jgi:hypothetical protein
LRQPDTFSGGWGQQLSFGKKIFLFCAMYNPMGVHFSSLFSLETGISVGVIRATFAELIVSLTKKDLTFQIFSCNFASA